MVLLRVEAQVDAHFGLFGDGIHVGGRQVHGLRQMYHWLRNRFGLQGEETQVKARFSPFGDIANLDARYVDVLRQTYHRLRNHFGHTRWNSLVTRLRWKLV